MAISRFGGRRKRPPLKVVGSSDPTPRHEIAINTHIDGVGASYLAIRIWTTDEWNRLDPDQRPEDARPFPGVGYVACRTVDRDEAQRIADAMAFHQPRNSS